MQMLTRIGSGLLGGAAGLLVMEAVRRATAPLVKERAPKPTDVLLTEKTISPTGVHHRRGEPATEALGRIVYEKVSDHEPSRSTKRRLSWTVHIAYGLLVAAGYGLVRGGHRRRAIRDGLLFGTGLWLLGDELAVPLLGLADKPTEYHSTHHAQSLAQHLGFGIAAAMTTRALERVR
jgi:uncharacterized membrane protein YagU involved in acid resistance